jgi:predicted dehydrogenase
MRFFLLLLVFTLTVRASDLRVGMIGLDTSHTVAFAKILNDPKSPNYIPGAVITGAFRSGSPDIPVHSMNRVEGYATELSTKYGVKLYDSIEELLANCDVVMIENVDGRKHLEIARVVFPTGKPTFIDKPLAGSLDEGIELVRLAEQYHVPFFSASSLRYAAQVTKLSEDQRASIRGAMAYSPCEYEPHHPDLFWYGIHGVETLYALLGSGCESVSRVQAPLGDVVTGRWADGRLGTFYGYRQAKSGYGYKAILKEGVANEDFSPDYVPLLRQVVTFFQTKRAPVGIAEMIEVLAFMEAADESKRRNGAPVSLAEIMAAHTSKADAAKAK